MSQWPRQAEIPTAPSCTTPAISCDQAIPVIILVIACLLEVCGRLGWGGGRPVSLLLTFISRSWYGGCYVLLGFSSHDCG